MSLAKPIGGYFEIEPQGKGEFPYPESILLNSGRNCFEYILRAGHFSKVYMPKYTCDVMLEPLQKANVGFEWYNINDDLEIENDIQLGSDELILYTNYFGVKNDYSLKLAQKYKDQLVLDCSQAFFFAPLSAGHTFYSPRKFFGLPDGGCLVTDHRLSGNLPVDASDGRMSHLYKRRDFGPEAGYEDFKQNDASLVNEPIKQMSDLTKGLISNIDYKHAQKTRNQNFQYLHDRLKASNGFKFNMEVDGPLVYPYLVADDALRKSLIEERIFVPTYWPNVFSWCEEDELEYGLAKNIMPLPIDQRYTTDDMERIINAIGSRT